MNEMTSGGERNPPAIVGLEYDWANEGDAEEVAALFARAFRRRLSVDYYRWQFFGAPHEERRCGVVRHEGRIISHVGYSARRALVNGTNGRVVLKFTSMSDPEYQGHGIYTSLMQWAHEHLRAAELDLVLSWPNVRNHPSQRNRTDYRDIYQPPMLLWSPEAATSCAEACDVPFPRACELDMSQWGPVALGTHGEARYCLERSCEYLSWRYQSHPTTTYYGIESRQGGAVEAALVFKLYPAAKPERINVVEWLCDPHDRSGAVVMEALEDYAVRAGLPITIWHNVHDYPRHHLLERRGYVPSAPVFYFGAFALASPERLGAYGDWEAWYIAMGDVDVF